MCSKLSLFLKAPQLRFHHARATGWVFDAEFATYFIALWCLVCYSLSWIGGWHALTQRYRFKQDFVGEQWRFRSGKMRWNASFGNCLTLGANRNGLYLAVLFLFRPGQPPLFIPWSEITVQRERRWLLWRIRFTLGKDTQIPLWISQRLGDQILEYHPEGITAARDVYSQPGSDPPRKLT